MAKKCAIHRPMTAMQRSRWTKEQLKLAFHLYCQLPFGRLDQRTPEVIELSGLIGRTPSALAMKLVNFASLDPAITGSGRKGLGNAGRLDREVWDEFHANWESLAVECSTLVTALRERSGRSLEVDNESANYTSTDFTGETRKALTEQRIKQGFFRRAVLSSYRGRCCMSGVSDSRLLLASHIVPWSRDKRNRLNPSNGLCLSAIHDRAFDKGLIALSDDFRVLVSDDLRRRNDPFLNYVLVSLDLRQIELPERFLPDPALVVRHRNEYFVDNLLR